VDRIFTAHGPQQAEQLLLSQVLADVRHSATQPHLLAKPLLVVVPSSELRLSLILRLAAAGAALGVEVQTLHSVALQLHRNAGNDTTSRSLLSEVLARRAIEQQPGLCSSFQPLADGLGLVASTLRDLLSAGWVGDVGVDVGDVSIQSKETLAAATQTAELMRLHRVRRPGDLQAQAAQLVNDHLHARAVWIHGFADVTGQSKSLIQALWDWGANMIVDLPPDPAFDGEDRGGRFVRRFVRKICNADLGKLSIPPTEARREFFHTSGTSDEVREVAHRIRALLADTSAGSGARSNAGSNGGGKISPERIGVIVRNFATYAADVRYWFEELGVPFRSASAPAGSFPDHRRMQAAIEVLQRGAEASVDRWLDALSRSAQGQTLASKVEDFRIAMRTLGVAHLEQAAKLDAAKIAGERGVYRLPVRTKVSEESPEVEAGAEQETRSVRSKTRFLTIAQLTLDIGLLQQTLERHQAWPAQAPLAEHAEYARLAFEKDFGWRANDDWVHLLTSLAELDGAEQEYSRAEFMILLSRSAKDFGIESAEANAGGVAILDFTQARARTFDHLFLLGLNRGAVPRSITDDPVLPDRQRGKLQKLIPDLQQKGQAHDEERYLFAQLCASAPKLTLSWLRADDDGKELAPSPYLQRIWLADRAGESEKQAFAVPRLRSALFSNQQQPLNRKEAAQYFALRGERSSWRQLLESETSATRHAVLDEYEPDYSMPEQREIAKLAGPYLGWIGARKNAPERVFVTRLEAIARCPWRTLLASRLRLEPVADPMHDLPSTDALMVGNVVHEALELLIKDQGSEVPRPKPSAVQQALAASALKVALGEELRLQGMIDALAAQAKPFLQRAVNFEWPEPDFVLPVEGCEVTEATTVNWNDLSFELSFRADRVDSGETGLIYTDYKASKPLTVAKGDATRAANHLKDLQRGTRLQATAYATSSTGAVGRYLFLNVADDLERRLAEICVTNSDPGFSESFSQTCGVLYQSLMLGVAAPRFETADGKKNKTCDYCDVADACLVNDSGNRRRLVASIEKLSMSRCHAPNEDRAAAELSVAELNLTDLWHLNEQANPWDVEETS
jgi:hypothetical protein